uniref:Uncharacterized protein n=1 Tax=Rhizophora mucronata TaxID=61149 RepID=A0A2P2JD53_RHIMU
MLLVRIAGKTRNQNGTSCSEVDGDERNPHNSLASVTSHTALYQQLAPDTQHLCKFHEILQYFIPAVWIICQVVREERILLFLREYLSSLDNWRVQFMEKTSL